MLVAAGLVVLLIVPAFALLYTLDQKGHFRRNGRTRGLGYRVSRLMGRFQLARGRVIPSRSSCVGDLRMARFQYS